MRSLILGDIARTDIANALVWSEQYFGEAARERYEALITAALKGIIVDPEFLGTYGRPKVGLGIRSWHLKISRFHVPNDVEIVRTPRHMFFYPVNPKSIQVAKLRHESMDLPRQIRF